MLGWINEKVEIEKASVILVANEEKLIFSTQDANDQKDEEQFKTEKIYKDFKEKVIGETFEIQSDLNEALDYFLEHTGEENRKHLTENKQVILAIYNDFYDDQQPNLRQLRQAIVIFGEWVDHIEKKYLENRDFISRLIQNFFVLKLVIVEDKLTEQDFSKKIGFNEQSKVSSGIKDNRLNFSNRYLQFFFGNFSKIDKILFEIDAWGRFLFSFDLRNINNYIAGIWILFEPSLLQKLWRFRELENSEFQKLSSQLVQEFNALKEMDYQGFLYCIDLLIEFCRHGMLEKNDIDSFKEKAFQYLEKYRKEWVKEHEKDHFKDAPDIPGQYYSSEVPVFQEIRSKFEEKREEVKREIEIEKNKEKQKEFFGLLQKGDEKPLMDFAYKPASPIRPLYEFIDLFQFIKVLHVCSNKSLNWLNRYLNNIYIGYDKLNYDSLEDAIQKDLSFWEKFKNELEKWIKDESPKGNVTYYDIKLLLDTVQKIIGILEEKREKFS